MKKLFTLIMLLAFAYGGHTKIIYTDAAASGLNNGTSWTNAYSSLQDALNSTTSDTIWVADGTYNVILNIYDSVKLFGGFVGNETSLSQRNWSGFQTILTTSGIVGVWMQGLAISALVDS